MFPYSTCSHTDTVHVPIQYMFPYSICIVVIDITVHGVCVCVEDTNKCYNVTYDSK